MNNDANTLWNIAKNLHKKSCRDETGHFLIEGQREIDLAVTHGVEIVHIFDKNNTVAKKLERISYRGQVIALAKTPQKKLQDFMLPAGKPGQAAATPLIIILDKLEKPGNIGAIIRTAEAAGVTAVIICDEITDIVNPNLIRASLGAVFSMPVFSASSEDALRWLEQNNIPVIIATPDAKKYYFDYDYSSALAIVLGSEANGISPLWEEIAAQRVSIPMTGEVNSLNVSVSAAILIYEAVSRRFVDII